MERRVAVCVCLCELIYVIIYVESCVNQKIIVFLRVEN